ncbi:peroxisomal biogenesis factor 19 isoform X1 [Amblyraja radiata]|uniref:peroxisomal biogenesis factor 19 isoform X1 n=1 Tax=Amblyraja radiata TaxID=386614 RepID=UPI001403A004|nr:peroxisomal biogenesis factor 19 isoform X1 [Amblyraja radiata]
MAEGGEEDPELQEILESALDDFDKPNPATQPTPPTLAAPPKSPRGATTEPLFSAQDRFFEELFDSELAAQASEEFDNAMRELAGQEPQLVEQFHKLSEVAGRVDMTGSDPASQQEFTSCLQQTLTGLAKNASDLQQSPEMSEEELSQAMDGLGMGPSGVPGETEAGLAPIMQDIVQSLLSKEVLYPSVKEIVVKYPDWLEAHRNSLPAEELRRYEQQHRLMERICTEFEAETDGEPEGRRNARFETILDLMQQLQDLGVPPKELAETPPGLNFDFDGGNLSGNAALGSEQCMVM